MRNINGLRDTMKREKKPTNKSFISWIIGMIGGVIREGIKWFLK